VYRVRYVLLCWVLRLAIATDVPLMHAVTCEQKDSAVGCSANISKEAAWSENMTLCYWYEHNVMANAKPLEVGWTALAQSVLVQQICCRSLRINLGAYIVRAAIVTKGAEEINSSTILGALAATTVFFDVQQPDGAEYWHY
jgi:hypothetical protein